MVKCVNQSILNIRYKSLMTIINNNGSYSELSKVWGISTSGCYLYVDRNLSDYKDQLSKNYKDSIGISSFDLIKRLKLLLLCDSNLILNKDAAKYLSISYNSWRKWKNNIRKDMFFGETIDDLFNDYVYLDS